MTAFIGIILRYRWLVLACMVAITLVSGVMITHGVIASSIGGLFLGEHPDYPKYLALADDFGSDDLVIVAIEQPDMLLPLNQNRLSRAIDTISEIEHVREVRSALSVQQIKSVSDVLYIDTYAEQAIDHPQQVKSITDALCHDVFAKGLFISKDGKSMVLVAELDTNSQRPAEKTPDIINGIINALTGNGFDRQNLHIVGLSANIAGVMSETYFSIKQLFPIVLVVLLATVMVVFRHIWPMIITGMVSLIAVIWTMGFSILLDRNVSVFTGLIPAVILIISFSDVIHMCSAFRIELRRGKSKRDAIQASGAEVGAACLFTSLTTFVGFVSLSLIPTPASRLLGIQLGFGTAVALLIAVTLTPILFSLFPAPKTWSEKQSNHVQDLLDRFLDGVYGFAFRHPWHIIITFLLFFMIIGVGLTRFTLQTDFPKRMAYHHPLRADGRFFRQHFVGANTLDIYIQASKIKDLLDPSLMQKVARYQQALCEMPEINRTYSLVDLFETMHRQMVPEQAKQNPLPSTRQALVQYLLLFEMSGGNDLERLIDTGRRVMRIVLHLPDEEYRHTAATGKKAEKLAQAMLGDSVKVHASGLVFLLGDFFSEVIRGQQRAMILSLASIALMMTICLRSLRAGIWSMFPNILPVLALCGLLGLFADYIDSDVIIVALIAVGIGVDDTIHFLMRYRIEYRRLHDIRQALEKTYQYSGRGIVMTTVILALGFSPFAISSYLSINMLGTLLPLTLIIALVADLFLVPALITVGAISFRSPN